MSLAGTVPFKLTGCRRSQPPPDGLGHSHRLSGCAGWRQPEPGSESESESARSRLGPALVGRRRISQAGPQIRPALPAGRSRSGGGSTRRRARRARPRARRVFGPTPSESRRPGTSPSQSVVRVGSPGLARARRAMSPNHCQWQVASPGKLQDQCRLRIAAGRCLPQ